jgi:hypothetical protein
MDLAVLRLPSYRALPDMQGKHIPNERVNQALFPT